ncbi:MAG: hypothetical protein H6988_12525 [Pseudomonadales bacterium]|nr:hypothetical protein [Pseudomonadales bacterium]
MSIRPFSGAFYLSDSGIAAATPWDKPKGPKPAAPAARAQAPEPGPDLDPSRIYSARAKVCAAARDNPSKPKRPTDADIFTAAASEAVYAARR